MGQTQTKPRKENSLSLIRKMIATGSLDSLEIFLRGVKETNTPLPTYDEYGLTIYHHVAIFSSQFTAAPPVKLTGILSRYSDLLSPLLPIREPLVFKMYIPTLTVKDINPRFGAEVKTSHTPYFKTFEFDRAFPHEMMATFLTFAPVTDYIKRVADNYKIVSEFLSRIPTSESSAVPPPRDETCCVVCTMRVKNVVIMPCRHLCVCAECSENKLLWCPICRTDVTGTMTVYL